MNIFNGGGWAFSDFGTADRFLKRLRSEADPDGNVIVGITVQSPINHLKNQTGQLAYIEAMQAAIDSKTITKRAADAQVAAMSSSIVQSTAKSIKQSARDKFAEIKSFKDLKKAVTNKQLNFADMEPMLTQMQRKALPITNKELSDIGMTAADIARDIADPELADVPFGSVVALLGVNVKQAPEKTGIHYSYPWTIHGDAIGYLNKFYNISDLSTEKRIRNAQGVVTAQPLQTVMPVMDNIINTIKTKQGIPSDPSMRFMPSSLTARDINAIAAEVGGGDVKGGAKAFGAFMRSMRDKGITLRDVVKSYGITLSSIQRQELPVSTIKKNWPDAPFQEGTKVRPEDAFAQLLGTPEGQKYLDAAERGVFDEQAADAVVQKFRSFGFHNKLKEQMKTAVEQFYPKAQEIIDAVNTMPTDKFIDYVRNNFKGISYGKVGFWSGQLGRGDIPTFDSRQGKLVYGKEVPVTKQVLMEQKDRLTQLGIKVPAAFKDFAQTLLHHEVWDRLNQSDTEHGPIKEAMLRFMPSDTDYLSAVEKGDTQAAQRMVDEAAKAAGYTIGPVYHGTPTGGFNVFDKRMRGETSGVSRQAFSFTTDKKAAEGYSKRLGDEAVRLDAGLRVANDAMRRFDDDVAAQEYFSSKGYSSVEDGMLPEFDWGSIDDVPEFIKELRGHAKDLKPINPDLASSFVEAAKVMTSTKAVPEVKRVFLRIPDNAPVFQATPATLGQVMSGFSAEKQPTKAGIVELPGNERIYYVADSSQVKLADPVTKDAQGNVIPLSQRFKATSEDIRYMPSTTQREVGRNIDFANPPTEEKAKAALSSSKQPFWREHESLPEGSPVGVRIDIPAFLNRGTYVQTIHEPATPGNVGDRIGYDTSVRLSGPVRFFVKEGSEESKLGAVAIKEGRAAKHPIATVEGKLIKDRSIPSDIETWTPVGMDPKKHSYFYDKRTDKPVTGGSESFSVGNTVFVKDPVYGNPQDFRYMPAGDMASGRSVKDHREAMDLFEKGYRLYGALYDGMEDPVRLKKASEIERFDPENLWAVPPRRVAAAIAIRNMPASEQDTKALQMLPKPRRSLDAAYQAGVKTRSQDPQYYDIPDYVGYDMARTAAFEMGREGAEPPRWVMAERIGKLPTEGRSKNFAEDKMERGVSVLRIVGEPQSDVGTYEMFNPGEKRYIAGWLVGLGSDGEPLLADAIDLGPVSGDVRMMPQPDSAMPGAYSFQGGYRAIPGKTKGSLRLYGPAGSLIGIASSLDEAQRILRRKAKQ